MKLLKLVALVSSLLCSLAASAGVLEVTLSGALTNFGTTGVLSGTVRFDPLLPPGSFFPVVDVTVTDGLFVLNMAPFTHTPMPGQTYDTGFDAISNPAKDFALWRSSDIDATTLLGDRLLFINFTALGGFSSAGGNAVATEYVCQDASCLVFNGNTVFRQGRIAYTVAPVPEPAAVWLLVGGLLGLGFLRRRTA